MTQSTDTEPTLRDVINRIDVLNGNVETLTKDVENLTKDVEDVKSNMEGFKTNLETSNERFSNYQQSVQWVVQLAFSLIASATITIIISSVLRK
jgi:peptidoglycan hydrolase CwlO-like protein